MKNFTYIVTDPEGIHARPAGLLVKKASSYKSNIFIQKDEKKMDAKKILAVMSLGVKNGQEVTILIDGDDENEAYDELQTFFTQNL